MPQQHCGRPTGRRGQGHHQHQLDRPAGHPDHCRGADRRSDQPVRGKRARPSRQPRWRGQHGQDGRRRADHRDRRHPASRTSSIRANAGAAGPGRTTPPAATSNATAIVTSPDCCRSGTATCASRRRPSGSRARCRTRSTAEANWLCAARPVEAGRDGQRLDPGRHIERGVGVQGPAAALMAGVHRGQQLDHLTTAHLPDHESIRAHPEGLAHQRAQGDLTGTLDVGRPGLEADHVRMVGPELARSPPREPDARPRPPSRAGPPATWSCRSRCHR